jgi:DNA primase
VIQFNQAGIENVVSSGTALTPDQIRLINRLTKNITVLLMGMQLDCVLPFEDLILEGMNVKVCTFPDGEDRTVLLRRPLMMI